MIVLLKYDVTWIGLLLNCIFLAVHVVVQVVDPDIGCWVGLYVGDLVGRC